MNLITGTSMSRARVALILLAAAALQGISLELAWVSATGTAIDSDVEQTVSLAGGAALPWASALILLILIAVVGAWVLPWWLRIAMAAIGIVAIAVVAIQTVRWLIAPDTSSITETVSGSDVLSEHLHVAGPGLFLLALITAFIGLRAMVVSSRRWPALSSRYDRGEGPADPWRSLDRGIDPTDDSR